MQYTYDSEKFSLKFLYILKDFVDYLNEDEYYSRNGKKSFKIRLYDLVPYNLKRIVNNDDTLKNVFNVHLSDYNFRGNYMALLVDDHTNEDGNPPINMSMLFFTADKSLFARAINLFISSFDKDIYYTDSYDEELGERKILELYDKVSKTSDNLSKLIVDESWNLLSPVVKSWYNIGEGISSKAFFELEYEGSEIAGDPNPRKNYSYYSNILSFVHGRMDVNMPLFENIQENVRNIIGHLNIGEMIEKTPKASLTKRIKKMILARLDAQHYENIYLKFLRISQKLTIRQVELEQIDYDVNSLTNDNEYVHFSSDGEYYGSLRVNIHRVVKRSMGLENINSWDTLPEYCYISKRLTHSNFSFMTSLYELNSDFTRDFDQNSIYRMNVWLSNYVYKNSEESYRCEICDNVIYTSPIFKLNVFEDNPSCFNHEDFNGGHICRRCQLQKERFDRFFTPWGKNVERMFIPKNALNVLPSQECIELYSRVNDWCYTPELKFINVGEKNDDERPRLYLGVELEFSSPSSHDYDYDEDEDYYGEDEDYSDTNNMFAKAYASITTRLQPHGYLMHDGSIRGFEFATMPSTLKAHMSEEKFDYKSGFEFIKNSGHGLRGCGMHVHVNRRFFGAGFEEQLYHGALMAYIIENNWDDFVTFSRRDYDSLNEWSSKRDLKYRFETSSSASDENTKLRESIEYEYGDDKYVFFNIRHSKTFEIRMFAGTGDYSEYMATLQLVSNLSHFVKGKKFKDVRETTFQDIVKFKSYVELDAEASYI